MASTLPTTSHRVPQHTSRAVNERIRSATVSTLDEIGHDSEKIAIRLQQLDQEWDVERVLEANAATVALLGLALGGTVSKRWFFLPAVVAGFLMQHAIQGWCPPVPIFRRLRFRTEREIDNERAVLKARLGILDGMKNRSSAQALEMMN